MRARIPGVHAYFVAERGTWFRRLGSYAIQIIERGATVPVKNDCRRSHASSAKSPRTVVPRKTSSAL
ncbi:hypothetical protein ACFV8Z_04930 [Streptomyces sp. NPDC059837]|uniref:hypothetical protein n=1 Tax=unclassified Streptomyces TaxID=2593676 RepID=UPI00224EFCB5|nr:MULTISPECIES: hypothetical protein [unclassified Streptomyces]MCX4409756.1 hypothetical protein [Streptomyces sp. NBC_01764]MCX5191531.1 hypothetical protein [Streptomyces sp. NBC_00268]